MTLLPMAQIETKNHRWVLKIWILVLVGIIAGFTGSQAQSAAAQTQSPPKIFSEKERTFLLEYFRATRTGLLSSVSGLSENQWNYRSGPDRWTIAEIVEHITIAENRIFDLISNRILQTPPVIDIPPSQITEDSILALAHDRTQKFQAPESIRPVHQFSDSKSVLEAFEKARGLTVTFVKETPVDLRRYFGPHPVFKQNIDGYQWLVVLAAHCERHTAQINEVKADPNFPGR